MAPLFDTILEHIPAPEGDPEGPLQMLISTIDYNEYVGRIGIGKISRGTIRVNQDALWSTITTRTSTRRSASPSSMSLTA
jgi:GTP-binding protein